MPETVLRLSHVCPAAPGGRFRWLGPGSGEELREDVLLPALQKGPVTFILDSRWGCGSGFLEETFGGVVRAGLKNRLTLIGEGPANEHALERALEFMQEAGA